MQSEVFMMTDKIYTIDEICEKVQPIAEKYRLIRVSLFGSLIYIFKQAKIHINGFLRQPEQCIMTLKQHSINQ